MTDDKRIPRRDQVEFHRVYFEFPKLVLPVVSIFAAAGAFLLRNDNEPELLAKIVYGIAMLSTLWLFSTSFKFVFAIVEELRNNNWEQEREEKLRAIEHARFPAFMKATILTLWAWIVALGILVALA